MNEIEAGGAVPADDLAVAVLSGRRVLLFQRHRMGGGSRRYRRCGILAGLAWRDARGRVRDFATACFWRMRIGPLRCAKMRRCGMSRSLRRPSCPRASASSRRRRRGGHSSRSRARHGIAKGSIGSFQSAAGRSSIRSRSVWSAPAHAIPLAPTMHGIPSRAGLELDIRRCAADPPRDKPIASACWLCWSRSWWRPRNGL